MKILFVLLVALLPAVAQAADNPAIDAAVQLPYGLNAWEQKEGGLTPIAPAPLAPKPSPEASALAQCTPAVPESFMKILSRLEAPAGAVETGMPPELAELPRSEPTAPARKDQAPSTASRNNVTRSNGITVYHGLSRGKTGTSQENGVQVYRGRVPTSDDQ